MNGTQFFSVQFASIKAKLPRKALIPTALRPLHDPTLKNDANVPSKSNKK
jgi:hypothetical protein